MRKIDLDSIFHHSDHLQKGHGLTLTKVYRSYKNSPHNVDATYLKYLVHRLENADKYESASPQEKFKMDVNFLDHHQQGSASEKNGHMTTDHLESFMLNPDTPKLAKQLLNHKKQLNNFIKKEHADHIENVNGEPHIRLTRGLNVDRAGRGADHALASYADIPDPRFGIYMHHQLVPLKNIWFAYDYGPKGATSKKFGNEDEFIVSSHQNIYNEGSPTKPIAVRRHHSLSASKLNFKFNSVAKNLNAQDIDKIIENDPEAAAKYLHNHPLLNAQHIDKIVENKPWAAAQYLHSHPLLNAQHIDKIVEKDPYAAALYLHNHPIYQAKYGNKIQKSLQKSFKTLKEEYEKLNKAISANNTWYPEYSDAQQNKPHPEKRHLMAAFGRNGTPTWTLTPHLAQREDNRLMLLASRPIKNVSNQNHRHVRELVTQLLDNPDRHVISANTDPNASTDNVELRVRHLSNALEGRDGYHLKDHPEGIEIYAPRHSGSTQAKDIATSWIYNPKTKSLKSKRIMAKSMTEVNDDTRRARQSISRHGEQHKRGGSLVKSNPSLGNKSLGTMETCKSGGQVRSLKSLIKSLDSASKLLKAEDDAGMTAIHLKNGYSLHHEHSENGHDIWSIGYNGQRAGTFMLRTENTRRGKPMVAWAGLEREYRGQGIGSLAYKALAAHYGGLDSDKSTTSDDAIRAWIKAGGRQMKLKTQYGKPRYTLDGDKKRPPIIWNEDLEKNNPSHSLHLINKFEGSDFAPTEFHYSVKSNGKEIGRAIVFDKDPRSIHQAGKTGPSLKDIRLHPDYQGQGHSQGIINKLVDMHGPLASDSRGNISPAGAKMFHKYGIKQPDESYILHGQSLKKSIENLIKNAHEDWKNEDLIKNNKNNALIVYHGSDTLPFGKKPTPYETTGIFVTPSIDLAKEFGKDIHTFSYPKEKILDLNNENHLQILKRKYTQSEIDYVKGDQGLPHALNASSDSSKKIDKLREMALNSGFHASFQQEIEWPNKPTSIEIYKTKHLTPQNKKNSIKKSSNINSLIQQAKARLEGVKKVGSQKPRPMIFASKDGKKHAFVTVDPSKKGQWRVTHFVNSKPAGHSEAPTFSHAIKVAHESGYNVFKEIPEEELFKAESLIKAAHPSDLRRITNKTNPKAQEIVDAAPHAVHAPDQTYVDFLNHPKVQKGLGKGDIGGISAKMVHKVGDDTYMAKPYHKKIESSTRAMNPHPISGWSTMATRNLFHAAGIGHLCEDVSFHEHNGVPMTVHKFAEDAEQIADPYRNSTFKHRIKNPDIEAEAKKIAVMDFLTNNVDRHGGNVMFRPNKDGTAYNLLAIDHERGFQYNQPASIRYKGSPAETPRAYLRHTGLSDAAPLHSWMDDEEASYMPEGHTTKDWWKANRDNIVNSFNKDIQSIKDPHLKKHIHTNFIRRVDWLDEFSHPDHYSFFSQHNNSFPVEMFKERRPKTDYKAIMKNLPENPYKAIGVIDGLFSKKLSFATRETLADLWNEQVDKMSGEEVGNYLKDIQKTKNHPHPKGAYWSLMNRLAQENHRQGMQHLVQNDMIDLPYWKNIFEARLKLGGVKKP